MFVTNENNFLFCLRSCFFTILLIITPDEFEILSITLNSNVFYLLENRTLSDIVYVLVLV